MPAANGFTLKKKKTLLMKDADELSAKTTLGLLGSSCGVCGVVETKAIPNTYSVKNRFQVPES